MAIGRVGSSPTFGKQGLIMGRKLVLANWKMNIPSCGIDTYANSVTAENLIVFPPAPYLTCLSGKGVKTGIQCISKNKSGSYTGETSAQIAAETGCKYTLIGHSERRQHWQEDNAQLLQQCLRAHEQQLTTIICIGESADEHNNNTSKAVIEQQLAFLSQLSDSQRIIIAYEPVWAIGAKQAASLETVNHTHQLIKNILNNDSIKILYGGSVDARNAANFLASDYIDGLLVGRASLDVDSINEILSSC